MGHGRGAGAPPTGRGAEFTWKRRDGGAGANLRRRGVHLWTQEADGTLVFLPLASSKGEGGREGSASRICCTQGFAKHMTSAKAGSASAQSPEMSFLQDPSSFTMGMWSIGAGALGAAALALVLANTDIFLSKPLQATLEYLEEIDLKTLEKEPRTFKAKELWEKNGAVIMAVRRPGCFLCREEAVDLSSLKPKLDELGVPLYAVVKEQIRTEVKDFQPYFKGEIFLDEKKKFYGPRRRKMMFMGFVRLGVWNNFFRARKVGVTGNLEGEGFILGGVFVVGSGKQGILLEHREKEFGDKVNPVSVLEAARKIKPQTSASEKK